ncbi:hypothetical protein D3C80_981720 [compost metagenome]
MAEQGLPRVQQTGADIALAQVDQFGGARQVGGLQQQAAHALLADDHGLHPADAEKLLRRGVLDGGIGQGLDAYRRQFGGLQPIHQPTLLEGGGAGHDDQGGDRQGEGHGQQQQAAGQAVGGARRQALSPDIRKTNSRQAPGQARLVSGACGRSGVDGVPFPHAASMPCRARHFCTNLSVRGSSIDRKATPSRGHMNSANRLCRFGLGSSTRMSFSPAPIQQ